MDFAYNVGDEVTLLQGNNDDGDRQVYWARAMNKLVGQKGIITERKLNEFLGRPVYRVDFGTNNWYVEEHWIKSDTSLHNTVTAEQSSAIDDFMKEW